MLSYEIKFITTDDTINVKNGDFKTYKYETKKKSEESVYDVGKRSFCEKRGGFYRSPRPRQLKQLEALLRDRSMVHCEWTSDSLVTLVFSSGVIVYLTIKPETLDVTQILFDKYCVGKLSGHTVTGVAMSKSYILIMHTDRMATLVTFGKTSCHLPSRISDRDPHVQTVELGSSTGRGCRRVSRSAGGCSLLWWAAAAQPAPWSPAAHDLANLHLYTVYGHQLSLLAYHQLDNETISAELAHKVDNVIHVVEQIANHKSGVTLNWIRFDPPPEERLTKLSSIEQYTTQVSLPAPVRASERSPCDTKLLMACIDGSIHLVHCTAGLVHSARAGFIPTACAWAGEAVAAAGAARLQLWDAALSPLPARQIHDNSTSRAYSLYARRSCMMVTAGGLLALVKITHPDLLPAWIRAGRLEQAVALLRASEWDSSGRQLHALRTILQAALRTRMDATTESAAEAALGSFFSPACGLCARAQRYAPAVHDVARKFFHHLLRRGRLEKALSLAVELSAWDLCMDARFAATARGLAHLAEEARELADGFARDESDCSSTCSSCSSQSYTDSDTPTTAPPLPRVHKPHTQHSIMPVHTQPHTMNTHSIRPNIHRYVDRDNNIWNIQEPNRKETNHVEFSNRLSPICEGRNGTEALYRYQPFPSTSVYGCEGDERRRLPEKNKVKFSDTVSVAVLKQPPPPPCPAVELAGSLPLCAPHNYLADFAPAQPHQPRVILENEAQNPPKIKVVHFGMV